jgi:hypothetical protein
MAKQPFNTRGRTQNELKEALRSKTQYARPNIAYRISRLQESLDYELFLKSVNEKEISYLEKFIAKKEQKTNDSKNDD